MTIARFRSSAEAGYFADELDRADGINCVLTSVDDFDAMSGGWGAVIHLRVAEGDATLAASRLRELLSSSSQDEDDVPYVREGVASEVTATPRTWLPIAIAFAAGSTLLFVVQNLELAAVMPQPQKRAPKELVDALAESREPWVQVIPGKGRLELHSEKGGVFVLREDRDGDGRFERSTTITTSQ